MPHNRGVANKIDDYVHDYDNFALLVCGMFVMKLGCDGQFVNPGKSLGRKYAQKEGVAVATPEYFYNM